MRQELLFSDSRVRRIVQAAFPNAKTRRTIKLEAKTTYHVSDYWDGGSRNYCAFVRLSDLRALSSQDIPKEQRQYIANPFNLPICDITLSPGFVVVEHCVFCGKDLGYRIYFHPGWSLNAGTGELLLPQKNDLGESQVCVRCNMDASGCKCVGNGGESGPFGNKNEP